MALRYRVPRLKKRSTRRKAGVYRRKRIARRNPFGRQGGFYITRKLPLMAVSSTAAGTVALADPTTSCITLGTPSLSVGFSNDVYDIPFTLKFQLDQLSQSSDLTSIGDQYKILKSYLRVYYNNSNSAYRAASAAGKLVSVPFIQYITDEDDANLPTQERLRAKMGVGLKTFKNNSSYIGIQRSPTPTMEVYAGGATSAYSPMAAWIDMTDDDVPHYAIKGILTQVPLLDTVDGTAVFTFDVALSVAVKGLQ